MKQQKINLLHTPHRVPNKLKGISLEKIEKTLRQKPSIAYLELHLADHCNLNCKGCGHFSPIAEERFTDLGKYKRDLEKLQDLFTTIRTIRLMGGEPLLNKQIEGFIFATRSAFPKTDLHIVTNGLLLEHMPETFWKACKDCSVNIDITIYPPFKEKESTLVDLVKANGLKVRAQSVNFFHAFYNKNGDTNAKVTFKKCRMKYYCPMLQDGKIFICSVTAMIDYFNKQYSLEVPKTGFVDIYTPGLTGWDVKKQLSKHSSTCSYCTIGWKNTPVFHWGVSNRALAEWDAILLIQAQSNQA
jgi:organic radical activating enzyme